MPIEQKNENKKDLRRASKSKEIVDVLLKEYYDKLGEISLNISILGQTFPKGKECWDTEYSKCKVCNKKEECDAKKRINFKELIEKDYDSHVFFMEQFNFIHPGIEEEIFFEDNSEIDLILIFPESTGSIDEFIKFSRNENIARKLRVFVKPRYHPLISKKTSMIRQSLLEFLTEYGHVYHYQDNKDLESIISQLISSYRIVKYKKMKEKEEKV